MKAQGGRDVERVHGAAEKQAAPASRTRNQEVKRGAPVFRGLKTSPFRAEMFVKTALPLHRKEAWEGLLHYIGSGGQCAGGLQLPPAGEQWTIQ